MAERQGGRNQGRLLHGRVLKLIDGDDGMQRFTLSELLHLPAVRNLDITSHTSSLLHRMVEGGHINLMQAFVPGGVWPQLIDHRTGSGDEIWTAEELAERRGYHEALAMIQQCSHWENSISNPLKVARDGSIDKLREMLLQEPFASLNQPDIRGYDLFAWACISGNEELVKFIIGHETDPRNMNANAHFSMLNWLPPLSWTPRNVVDLVLPKFTILCDDVVTAVNQRGDGPDRVPLVKQAYDVGNVYVAGQLLDLGAACPPALRISIEEKLQISH